MNNGADPHYTICVRGHLDKRRLSALTDFTVAHHDNGQTTISGCIPDQAALYGLLNRLRDLGVSLISVNQT